MNKKIIVDTSIWIEYFRNNNSIVNMIERGLVSDTIYITGPIVSELLQGVRSDREYQTLSMHIDAVPYVNCKRNHHSSN